MLSIKISLRKAHRAPSSDAADIRLSSLPRLGGALELTSNPQWGEHCRKEALAMAAQLDNYLSDGKNWLLGGNEPSFSDITLVTAIAFGKFGPMETDLTHRFEHLNKYWQRWQQRESFKVSQADVPARRIMVARRACSSESD